MKKFTFPLLILLLTSSIGLFAQKDTSINKQFMLVVRYKANMKMPSQVVLQNNIKHWINYMSGMTQSGILVSGFRPSTEGRTVTDTSKLVKDGAYVTNGDILSSILIIKSASIEEATAVAKNCPILELGGSVEIRPVMNIAQ